MIYFLPLFLQGVFVHTLVNTSWLLPWFWASENETVCELSIIVVIDIPIYLLANVVSFQHEVSQKFSVFLHFF